jgi:diguanylate cyclase (GGDEF)-like protein
VHIEDIAERKTREAELSHQALQDPLTGLANRALLVERIREFLSQRGRHARPGQLFYLDLNGFKAVNDRYGHSAGDGVLIHLAHRLTALLRVGDTAARLGGDEFAVLCEELEEERQAAAIAERLRAAAAQPFVVDDTEITLSAAVGKLPRVQRRSCRRAARGRPPHV